jgi:hypothetical protein
MDGAGCVFRRSRPPDPLEAVQLFRAMPSTVEREVVAGAGEGHQATLVGSVLVSLVESYTRRMDPPLRTMR